MGLGGKGLLRAGGRTGLLAVLGEAPVLIKYTLSLFNLVLDMSALASAMLFITVYNYFIRKAYLHLNTAHSSRFWTHLLYAVRERKNGLDFTIYSSLISLLVDKIRGYKSDRNLSGHLNVNVIYLPIFHIQNPSIYFRLPLHVPSFTKLCKHLSPFL